MPITYGSVCSGVEAATQAWHSLSMRAAWFAEIEPFPSAVLAHHYPDVPNYGDMTKLAALVLAGKIPAPDVLVGGTPCQAFSVAGMREGLTDPRGALTIKYVELADAVDYVRAGQRKPASVIVWENVPGVLSDKGNAFGCFLGALAGEDCELQPPGKKWQDAGCVYGPKRTIAWRVLDAQYFGLAQRRRRVFVVASARDGFDPTEILFEREGTRWDSPPGWPAKLALHPTLTAQGGGYLDDREAYVLEPEGIRRTSVIEWERCQGFPDNYTQIPWRGKPASECPDGPRYKAIGNSKAVTVVRWIGRRLLRQLAS
ncbi:DNA cytosine methyltransferase [Pseudomonas cremoris]|uniref:DNA cytosine methyltransferase n=1 Tax=Pseudomonas cremoris TaxID=2724178 RepID=UPI0028995283|nr:DNA cytosine methyltransferase [Pseudomonas cremoris]